MLFDSRIIANALIESLSRIQFWGCGWIPVYWDCRRSGSSSVRQFLNRYPFWTSCGPNTVCPFFAPTRSPTAIPFLSTASRCLLNFCCHCRKFPDSGVEALLIKCSKTQEQSIVRSSCCAVTAEQS